MLPPEHSYSRLWLVQIVLKHACNGTIGGPVMRSLYCAVATILLVAVSHPAPAQSLADIVQRLDALEKSNAQLAASNTDLKKENAALRERVRRIESAKQATVRESPSPVSSRLILASGGPAVSPIASAYKAPTVTEAPWTWTGLYIGPHAGWTSGNTRGSLNGNTTNATSEDLRGYVAGGHFGYNHQFNRVVLGAEVGATWTDADGTGKCYFRPPNPLNEMVDCAARQGWSAESLIRIGYTFGDGRVLPYVLAGASISHLRIATFDRDLSPPPDNFSLVTTGNGNLPGVPYGMGVQWAAFRHVSIGAEYLHAQYGSVDMSGPFVFRNPALLQSGIAVANRDLSTDTVRTVVNYRFED